MQKRVGIWIRVSTDHQAESDSPKHHEDRARAYADLKEWQVVEVYNLAGVSGKSVLNHPETKRMMEDVRRGHISALVFSKLARLGRKAKELLELADFFQKYNADLVSMGDSLDTSTAMGRFFFTTLAGFGEFEREEIVDRVKKSIPERAQMGKSLGGEAPFGYKWENKQLHLEEKEALIRKLMFELFLQHKQKTKVITILNERGYRNRKGEELNTTLLTRCLEDPIAKGQRRVNYMMSSGDRKHARLKPESEWIFVSAPAIVTEELWNQCNEILKAERDGKTKKRRPGVHIFSGVIFCHCGHKMYMRSQSPRYVCSGKTCKNQIEPSMLEDFYRKQLVGIIEQETEIQKHINKERDRISTLNTQYSDHSLRMRELTTQINNLFELYNAKQLVKEDFSKYHEPLSKELKQRQTALVDTEAQMNALKIDTLNEEYVYQEAKDLYNLWPTMAIEQKQQLVQNITKRVTVGETKIKIELFAFPTAPDKETANNIGSANLLILAAPISPEWVQKPNDTVAGR